MSFGEILVLSGSIVLSFGGSAAIIIAASSWLGKVWANRILAKDRERFREETEKALESIRGDREKGVFVHRVQFEAEFQAYREIWSCLSDCTSNALRLRPMMDYIDPQKTKDEIKKERLQSFYESFGALVEIIRANKPFVPDSLDESINETLKELRHEAIDYEHLSEENSGVREYWDKQKENSQKIQKNADLICDLIRERVGLLVVIEDGKN